VEKGRDAPVGGGCLWPLPGEVRGKLQVKDPQRTLGPLSHACGNGDRASPRREGPFLPRKTARVSARRHGIVSRPPWPESELRLTAAANPFSQPTMTPACGPRRLCCELVRRTWSRTPSPDSPSAVWSLASVRSTEFTTRPLSYSL
jgi:hypothetical protein